MTPAVLDLIIAAVILLSVVIAYLRGLIREVFTIGALVAAAVAAWTGGHVFVPVFNDWFDVTEDGGERAAEIVTAGSNADIASREAINAATHKGELILGIIAPSVAAQACAYGAVFLGVFLLVSLVSFSLSRGIDEMGMGVVDRVLGGVFGFARGFLLVFLFYVPAAFLVDRENFPAWAKNSYSVPVLEQAFAQVDRKFRLTEKIEDHGGNIAIRINKIDPADLAPAGGADDRDEYTVTPQAERELQDALTREEMQRRPPPAAPGVPAREDSL